MSLKTIEIDLYATLVIIQMIIALVFTVATPSKANS